MEMKDRVREDEFNVELLDETFDVTCDNDVSSIATCTCDSSDAPTREVAT